MMKASFLGETLDGDSSTWLGDSQSFTVPVMQCDPLWFIMLVYLLLFDSSIRIINLSVFIPIDHLFVL